MVRVVHVLGTLSSYRLADEQNAPAVRWETDTGTWVGIFDQHWSDLLCRAILRVTSAFDLEVWQPDLRADRIYEHIFDDDLKHVLFPARCKGLSGDEFAVDPFGIECPALFEAIKCLGPGTILHLNELTNPLTEKILQHLPDRHVPIILEQHGGFTYASMARRGKNLCRRWRYWRKAPEQRRLCEHIACVVAQTQRSKEDLRQVFSGEIHLIPEGLDFDQWQLGDKRAAREALDLPDDLSILLTACMLRPKKQIDKVIQVLVDLAPRYKNFFLLVVGGGDPDYEAQLKYLAEPLVATGKVRFLGRVPDDVLLTAYHAADLFLSVASSEAGPVSVVKAFACEVPVFTTDTGHTADFMREQGVGVIVPNSPRIWKQRLSSILCGGKVPVVSREVARMTYDYPIRARRFVAIYQEVLARHGIRVDAL